MTKNHDTFRQIREAVEARDRFLREHPELRDLQDEITERTKNLGSVANRMALLDAMMRERIAQLRRHLIELKAYLESLDEPAYGAAPAPRNGRIVGPAGAWPVSPVQRPKPPAKGGGDTPDPPRPES